MYAKALYDDTEHCIVSLLLFCRTISRPVILLFTNRILFRFLKLVACLIADILHG